jgi:hypothetical protein
MAHRLAAVSVAALLIAVSVFAVVSLTVPSERAQAPPTTAVTPSIPLISVTPLNQFDNPTYNFYPGNGGRVYFAVSDPGDDDSVIVHINDTNATRDGLTNPVATWTVNVSSGSYDSTLHGLQYTIPTSVTWSGTWNITASGAIGGNSTTTFNVQTYSMLLTGSSVVLPGFSGSAGFTIAGIPSGTPYTALSNVNVSASYYDRNTSTDRPLALSQSFFGAGVNSGTVTFLLPVNASYQGHIEIHVWANVSNNGRFSDEQSLYIAIGVYEYTDVDFDCNCLDQAVLPNTQVDLYLYPVMYSDEYGTQYAPGITATLSFWSGTTRIANASIPGSPPTSVVSGANGEASILFIASPSVFSTVATDQINVTVVETPSVNGSHPVYDNYTEQFVIASNGTTGASIVSSFSAAGYYGGETGSVNWTVLTLGGGTAGSWSGIAYEIETDPYDAPAAVVQYGLLSGTSGSITFVAPSSYTGEIELMIEAHNQSSFILGTAYADVQSAGILLSPSESDYNPGDTVQIAVQTSGAAFASATLFESTYIYADVSLLSSSVVTGDSFSVAIPSGVAPPELEVIVTAQSPTLGVFATGEIYLYESTGLDLSAGISTVSKYTDGSFQPGQTLTVTWSVSSYGPGSGSASSWVYLWNANGWNGDSAPLAEVLTTATSGSFQYTIPSGTPAGTQTLYVEYQSAGDCNNHCYTTSSVSYAVNPNPSALSMELGAGSGLTVGWLLLLVIIIVVALILVLLIRRGRNPKTPAASFTPTSSTMAPPAPPPSSPGAQQWNEPSAPASQPPLPPPGAQ